MPERKRLHYEGSTFGHLIQGVDVRELSKEWHVAWAAKKRMYGNQKHLIRVGGKTDGMDVKKTQAVKVTDTTILPVTYHGMPLQLYLELRHAFYAKPILDLSLLDGKLAWVVFLLQTG